MAAGRHVYEVYIKATPERVWEAIVDPAFTSQYFHGTRIESTFEPGTPHRYVLPDGTDAAIGTIEECDPPRRLVMTWGFTYAPELAAEPPGRVEWTLTEAAPGMTRLNVVHGDLGRSPLTWARVEHGWNWVLHGLKTLVETGEPLPDETLNAPQATADADGEWQRQMAIAANNGTWEYLGRPAAERTPADDEAMTQSAYAAAYHWARATRRGPENEARAEWLLSRVWAVRGNGALALHHAGRCATVTAEAGLTDFDLAYAHEARARALACLGRLDEATAEFESAAAVPIADPEDREIVHADLYTEPWFGLQLPVAIAAVSSNT
jgi:uncharacterized protein YndB with AHSA1/START domain